MKSARTTVVEVAFLDSGPVAGDPVVLLHGFAYDVHAYDAIAGRLADDGRRVIVPYRRGFGPTRFLDPQTLRSGQQGALAADLLGLLNALQIERATLVGYDWGGRAACIVAALWPERVSGLVSVDGYNLQDIAAAAEPLAPDDEYRFWYQHYFNADRGPAGLRLHRTELCKLLWELWSPTWDFGSAFDLTAASFANPDFVDVVIHSYRHRFGRVGGDPEYDDIERRLAEQPTIDVPTVVLYGGDDGVGGHPNWATRPGTSASSRVCSTNRSFPAWGTTSRRKPPTPWSIQCAPWRRSDPSARIGVARTARRYVVIVVGLTGGIGSGKSTVSAALAELGAVVIDADATARQLQEPGQSVFMAIVHRFGNEMVAADGTLDRLALAALVFPNPDLLKDLNALTHPAIGAEIRSRMRAHVGTDVVVVLDVPLLIENSRYPVAGVAVVDLPVETAVDRLVNSRGMDEADARARIARQATREERLAKADFVIDNSADRAALTAQITPLWEWMRSLDPVADDDIRLTDAVDWSPIDNHLS